PEFPASVILNSPLSSKSPSSPPCQIRKVLFFNGFSGVTSPTIVPPSTRQYSGSPSQPSRFCPLNMEMKSLLCSVSVDCSAVVASLLLAEPPQLPNTKAEATIPNFIAVNFEIMCMSYSFFLFVIYKLRDLDYLLISDKPSNLSVLQNSVG